VDTGFPQKMRRAEDRSMSDSSSTMAAAESRIAMLASQRREQRS
jgi:hypothetical protein